MGTVDIELGHFVEGVASIFYFHDHLLCWTMHFDTFFFPRIFIRSQ